MKKTEITRQLIKYLRAQGCFVFKHRSGTFSRRGIADVFPVAGSQAAGGRVSAPSA